ncbi:MAG: glycosyltransferase family 2 protein [Candidatus Heimdallarchaeum endolithica]|uniref:Glycosyltransferase family 2 protein n=1 Tax=Candidatus Heimdallarchaeum endolithica TaxID=2876572 RepID=A0A9Y1FPN1_9ARCH|nr:MAG: glycosyltransferase family 2 protein [Candidatus Heimdallarchaeum endolithica]
MEGRNIFKKVGFFCAAFSFLLLTLMLFVFLIIEFVQSAILWISMLSEIKQGLSLYILSLSLIIIFTFGIILYIIGEFVQFFFGKYQSLLLDKKEYVLSPEEKEMVTVIIPAYNEEETIEKAIKEVKPYCNHVVVINDGSTDNTKQKAEMAGAIVVNHKLNQGLGKSLRDGVRKALSLGSEIIINFDADLQYKAKDIPSLVYYIIHEDYDLMMGSRLAGKIEKMHWFKKFGNKLYTKLLRYLTKVGISDGQTGFRAFSAEFAKQIKIRGDFTYTQEMILEAVSKKSKIGEVPIYFRKRDSGSSRLMKNPMHFAKASGIFLLKVLVDLNPLKVYSLFSSFLIIIGYYLGGKYVLDWFVIGEISNPFWATIGVIIVMTAIIILSFGFLISATKHDN